MSGPEQVTVNQAGRQQRALHLHTLDSLFSDLISGQPVIVDSGSFELSSGNAKSILNWYRVNRTKWQGRMSEADAEAIVECVGKPVPSLPVPSIAIANANHRLRLVSVRAHRFGGLHAYGSESEAPPDFIFQPSDSLTLLEGWNGSGKTSLLNAIVWCLTGMVLRPQRTPANGAEEFDSLVEREGDEGPTFTAHTLTPVTPLPSLSGFMPAPDQKIPVDTWVELTFADEEGVLLPPIRRTQTRTQRGKLSEQPPNLTSLGVDPVAFTISTTMPAVLQHLQLGEASDLGRAVSQLTGLSELTTLQRHAERASTYIKDKLRKRAEDRIVDADNRFNEAVHDLRGRIEEFPAMAPEGALPVPTADGRAEIEVAQLQSHFVSRKAAALQAARQIIGGTFDPDDAAARANLEESIPFARAELQRLGQLESAARLGGLGKLSDDEMKDANALLDAIFSQAATLGALISDPPLAARKHLYASVASWALANGVATDVHCHICNSPLVDQIDAATGKLVRVHLEEARHEEPELLSQTIQSWAQRCNALLADKLPAALRDERSKDLPESPVVLLRQAVCEELFSAKPFVGALSALQVETRANFEEQASLLLDYREPKLWSAPEGLGSDVAVLEKAVGRIQRAISFAAWRRQAKEALGTLFSAVVGRDAGPDPATQMDTQSPLSSKLGALQSIVDGASPITDAIEYCERMSKALTERRKAESTIKACDEARTALAELERLGTLASAQIEALQRNLESSAARWRAKIYMAPVSGPFIKRTAMSASGVIEFQAGNGKISAPAQHISNASALRASLIAFFLAFREHVLRVRGGLELLLLDDPQELLDEHNRSRMADVIVELAAGTAQPIITTYDRNFAMMIASEATTKCAFTHQSIHGVNARRDTIALGPARRQLDEDRQAFEQNIDDHPAALRYATTTRTYIETRLRDLFDDPAYPAYASPAMKPTLGDHLNYLRSLVATPPSALFSHASVTKFARHPGLAADSECYAVLNDAHHTPGAVSYGRVTAVASHLRTIASGIEDLHRAFRDWRSNNRLPQAPANDNLLPLTSIAASDRRFVVHPNLAAFSGPGTIEGSQEEATDAFSSSWFDDKSLFYIRADNFGFAIPKGYIAIVEATPAAGRDRNLVIARRKGETLARRLFRQGDGYALAAETPDPRESPPTKMVRGEDYALHRVVGCLLVESVPPVSGREAVQVDRDKIVDEIKAVYRLNQESAVPLALPGQLLLGGEHVLPAELGQHEAKLAAITLKDGSELLKRIGAPVSAKFPYLRHFETIGGLGQSIVLQTEELEDGMWDGPIVDYVRLVIGVLYED
ncbi:AAA family ATPase [Prosthecomicrobium pneumaticum]|uniref:Rad50/SbcC-type AAA domain-containing protein n=1 Tax=Prosthecomicrobium pneumaticum TaxID=81895 RepID=A0A7W9FN64_9HYPH|nr:AAA family ATPase [Prosthecomicrobium pneumaticum]MBB5753784.1 hypothetical protein [Prosthecomicrobium pneumaticum]